MSTFYTNTASIDNLFVTSSAILSGSVTVYGSLNATASYSTNAITSSYALTASYASNVPSSTVFTGSFTGSFVGNGSGLTNLNSDNLTLPSTEFGNMNSGDKFLVYNSGNGRITLTNLLTQFAGPNLENYSGSGLKLQSNITGLTSVTSTGFTGSLHGTASYSSTSVSSSYATTASYYAGGVSISNPTDNRVITSDGTSTGLNGEVHLTFDGSTLLVVGNVDAQSFTGSLKGTATTASLAISSSYATTASYVLNSVSASFATTASYVLNSVSASFATTATTASYVLNAVSASRATTAATASLSTSASYAAIPQFPTFNVGNLGPTTTFFVNTDLNQDNNFNRNITWGDLLTDIAGTNLASDGDSVNLSTTITGLTSVTSTSFTGSLQGTATTASYYGGTVTSASFAQTASYVLNSVSSSFATNSMTASYFNGTVTSASFATNSMTASYVLNAVSASRATTAATASVATSASYAAIPQFPTFNVAGANSLTTFFVNTDLNQDNNFNRNITWGDLLTDIAGTNLASDGDSVNLSTTITGLTSVTSTSFTGSLQGVASTASYFGGTVTSASFASTASYWSGTVTSASYAQTATTASYSYQQFSNVETLSGTKTILSTDPSVQILNPNGATRTVVLPTNVPTGSKFEIWNSGIDVASNTLYVGDGVYYGFQVDPSKKITVRYTGKNVFTGPDYPWMIDGETAVSVASNYNNYSYGIGIGYVANNNYDYGIGIGRTAQNNYTNGVGIGFEAQNNYSYGVGTGYSAYNNYTYGIGIGYYAYNNNSNGIGIGKSAYSNYSSGIGIGENASSNYNYGVGIGQNAQNNYNYGVSIGAVATSNAKGTGTVAIGAYSKAERQNEFVTTGTGISTNQAQSIIQKFRNKSLATAAGAFQEIFTDASSGRLTILASSIYQFRIQINAIEATGFKCKTWEITGAVKRDASNNTTMVGGAPTYYITSEDSGTGNWDVKASANDTNEALKIEVKHDSANNVTFSATVWATETRL